jgi:hypothetical protein
MPSPATPLSKRCGQSGRSCSDAQACALIARVRGSSTDRGFGSPYYVPPGVLVDEKGEILHFRGDVSPYLAQSEGKPSHSLLKVAREGLFAPLRSALQQAADGAPGARFENAVVKNGEGLTTVSINVLLVTYSAASRPTYWVLFEPSAETLEQRMLIQTRRLEAGMTSRAKSLCSRMN